MKKRYLCNKNVLILVGILGILLSFWGTSGFAKENFPKPVGYVNDFAGILDQRGKAEIQLTAEALAKEQGIELAVVTVDSTAPMTPKEYAVALFNEWGIGGPEDSGLLMLLSIDDRRIEVEVGYGLEPYLTDGTVGAILDKVVVPHLSKGDYSQGLAEGAEAFRLALNGESFATKAKDSSAARNWIKTFLIFLAIAILVSSHNHGNPPDGPRNRGRRITPRVYPRPGGFGGGGRSSGGGFGGFGGGRSGGGGSGRSF